MVLNADDEIDRQQPGVMALPLATPALDGTVLARIRYGTQYGRRRAVGDGTRVA